MMTSRRGGYRVKFLNEATGPMGDEGNVDVVVEFESSRRYGATFFTLENVERLLERYRTTGECAGGLYFWASDMIVVRKLDQHTIIGAVADLIETGEFDNAFRELD